MKIKKNIRLSDSYYSKSEIEELYSKGLIDIRDYSEIENIDIKNKEAYLNGVLIDHCYYGQKYSFGSTYFYAKKDDNIVVCDVYCGIEGQTGFDSLYIYRLDILDKYSKLKYLL